MRKIIPYLFLFTMLCLLSGCAQPVQQSVATDVTNFSVNHLDFSEPVSDTFNFIVYGHSYGSGLAADEFPSITLRSNLDSLLSMGPEFVFSLGDMVHDSIPQQFADLDTMLLSKFDVPVFNVVGNHDVNDRDLYESLFGQSTYYTFQYANALFIVLDTEIDDCYIEGDQLEMLQSSIEKGLSDDAIDNIFIMMHKVLYMDSYLMTVNESYMVRTNDLKIFEGNNFSDIMDSLLIPAAKKKPIHIFAGDVGAFNGNLSPYYQKQKSADLYMYASGLGDSENDVVLIVNNDGKSVTVTPYLLASGTELKIEDYGQSYWENYGTEIENWKDSVKDYGIECAYSVCRVGKNVFHLQCRYFLLIIGFILVGGFTALVIWIRKRTRKK